MEEVWKSPTSSSTDSIWEHSGGKRITGRWQIHNKHFIYLTRLAVWLNKDHSATPGLVWTPGPNPGDSLSQK